MTEPRTRIRAQVHGLVQGVCFRASTAERAAELALAGWVRNRADGTVELEVEGDPASVAALIEWCRVGPPSARVDRIEQAVLPATGEAGAFRVVR